MYKPEEAKPAFVLEPHSIFLVCVYVFRSKKNCCSIDHAQHILVWELIEDCVQARRSRTFVLEPHSISLVCACVCFVLKKPVVQLTMLSTNKTCLPPKLDLPNATSMHWGHLDTYICYHITLSVKFLYG